MALEDSCTLHNELGNDGEVGASKTGPNGVWTGASDYIACKFNDGSHSNNNSNYVSFDGNCISPNEHIIEFWFKTDDWGFLNGNYVGPARVHALFDWYYDANNWFTFISNTTLGMGQQLNYAGGSSYAWFQEAGMDWAAGELHHMFLAYKRTGIDGGPNIRRLYLDGNLVATNNVAPNACVVTGGTFHLFNSQIYGLTVRAYATEDNIKAYNDVSAGTIAAIIANKDNEGWPVLGGGRLIDGRMIAPLIDGSLMVN